MNLVREMVTMSTPGRVVINAIIQKIEWDNDTGEVKLPMSELTKAEQQQFKKGYKELVGLNLVVRTKRSYYMVNPSAVIPYNYDKALTLWDSLH